MGSIQTRKRMHLFLHFACLVILPFVIFGCLHYSKKLQGEDLLAKAMNLMLEGQYDAALAENLTVLEEFPPILSDQAHFQIGLIYAHPKNPKQNYQESLGSFIEIVKEFPQSRLRDQAQIWVLFIRNISDKKRDIGMLNNKIVLLEKTVKEQREGLNHLLEQIEELKQQIEELKRVDLGIEENKQKNLYLFENIEE